MEKVEGTLIPIHPDSYVYELEFPIDQLDNIKFFSSGTYDLGRPKMKSYYNNKVTYLGHISLLTKWINKNKEFIKVDYVKEFIHWNEALCRWNKYKKE